MLISLDSPPCVAFTEYYRLFLSCSPLTSFILVERQAGQPERKQTCQGSTDRQGAHGGRPEDSGEEEQ